MKFSPSFLMLLCWFAGSSMAGAQAPERFTSCAAIFLDQKMLVDEYSPTGRCRVAQTARGVLSVHTVDLGPDGGRAVDRLKFRVAIRDAQTKTLLSWSERTYREVDLAPLLARCRPGDAIVILTIDDRYALPHAEVVVE